MCPFEMVRHFSRVSIRKRITMFRFVCLLVLFLYILGDVTGWSRACKGYSSPTTARRKVRKYQNIKISKWTSKKITGITTHILKSQTSRTKKVGRVCHPARVKLINSIKRSVWMCFRLLRTTCIMTDIRPLYDHIYICLCIYATLCYSLSY